MFLEDNIKPFLDTINGFQLAVENSRNNDFLYCIKLGLYMANWTLDFFPFYFYGYVYMHMRTTTTITTTTIKLMHIHAI